MANPSPITESTDLIELTVLINGSQINSTYQVFSATVFKEANKIPFAKLQILDGSHEIEDFLISDSKDFIPGNEIEIKAGYQCSMETIFSGIITKQGVKVRNGSSFFLLECRDKAVKMTLGRKNAHFQDLKDSDIISQITGTYNLTASVDATSATLKQVIQYYVTDWDFVLSRADVNGLIVISDNGKISCKKPDTSQKPVLRVAYGESLLNVNLEMDATTQLSSVQCSSWDISTQSVINVTATDPDLSLPGEMSTIQLADVADPSTFQLQTIAPIGQESLQSWADAQLTKAMMSKIRGTISFQGSSLVTPGVMLELAGLSSQFNGNAFVSGAKHTIEDGNWITEAVIGLSSKWFSESRENITSAEASGLLPGVQGLQIGQVSDFKQDPDGQYRVLVKVPLTDMKEGVWARLSSLYATNSKGIFFFPEKDDEVILGFFNNDPRYPVVLGSLYSSNRASPYEPDDKNTFKGIVTNNQLKLEFNDDKKIITIETPAGNKIVFSEDAKSIEMTDQNSNTIKLNSDGITMSSNKDITITANGNISLKAEEGTFSLKATQDITLKSDMNITHSAEIGFTGKGNATAEISSEGDTTIKGTMVMIN